MENFFSGGAIQTDTETDHKQELEDSLSTTMTAPTFTDKLPEILKGKVPECTVLEDNDLTLSILNELGTSNVSDSSIDLQLRFQRLLAESFLESSAFDTSKNQAEMSKNEFTLGTSTPRFSQSNASIFGESNKQKTEEFEALFKKYYSEEFVPAEEATDRLIADEIAWKKEFAFSPPVNDKLELSCFSGIIGDAEISLRSVTGAQNLKKNKVTPEEYFSMKTDKMGSLDTILSSKDRPNFGHDIESPNVNRARIAFVEPATNDVPENLDSVTEVSAREASSQHSISQSHNDENDLNVTPCEKSCSTLSVTSIEDILSKHLQDTPGTIARSILNPKNKTKSTFNQDTSSLVSSEQMSGFSDNPVEKTLSELSDWIQVEMQQTEYEAYVGSDMKAVLQIQSQSSRWLKCNITLHKIVCNKAIDVAVEKELSSQMQLPDITLVGPGQRTVQKVIITPTLPGNFEIYVNVNAEDAVTQLCKNRIVKFHLISKMPKVEVHEKGVPVNEVDFGTLPENCSQLIRLEIINYSDSNLPLTLDLEEASSTHHTFALCKNDNDTSVTSSGEKNLEVNVAYKAPHIENHKETQDGFLYYSAYLNIATVVSSGAKTCLLKKIKLKGRVGITKLLFNFKSPVELSSPGPGISNSKTLSMKNGGVVPLDLKLTVVDFESWKIQANTVITVSNPELYILPGKETSISLVFTPSWVFEEHIKRKLLIHIAPNGNLFDVDIYASIKNEQKGQVKERLSCQSTGSSQSAASSTRSITGMPVQTTHKHLVWNTVPVGKIEMQSCRLRNDWPTTVKIHLSLVDYTHGFWLLNENGEHVLERILRLHAKECIPVNVIFFPTKVGVAFGKLVIREAKHTGSSERFAIPLFGYCGTYNMNIRNISKDKSGNMWINLGPLDNNLHSQFTVFNKGNLESFVYVKYVPKGVGALLQGVCVSIEPSKIVVAPGSSEIIKISFALQNDVSFINKDERDMLELGNLYVTCGDEPTRQRLRRIREMQPGNPTLNRILNLDSICSTFPGETCISELSSLNDPESALRSLCRTLVMHEVVLTVECIDDRSLAMQTCIGPGHLGNQSLVFRSMLPDATFSASVEEASGKEVSSWSITPSTLTLLVPKFASGCITIASTLKDDQVFEINSSEDFLSIEPSSGIIPGMGEVVVVVTCNVSSVPKTTSIKSSLKIFLENDVKIVTVHIKPPPENGVQRNKSVPRKAEGPQKGSLTSAKVSKNETNKQKSIQFTHSSSNT